MRARRCRSASRRSRASPSTRRTGVERGVSTGDAPRVVGQAAKKAAAIKGATRALAVTHKFLRHWPVEVAALQASMERSSRLQPAIERRRTSTLRTQGRRCSSFCRAPSLVRGSRSLTISSFNTQRVGPKTTARLTLVVTVCGESLSVSLDPHGQHTLSWRQPVTDPKTGVTLPPGSVNLYKYPLVTAQPLRQGSLSARLRAVGGMGMVKSIASAAKRVSKPPAPSSDGAHRRVDASQRRPSADDGSRRPSGMGSLLAVPPVLTRASAVSLSWFDELGFSKTFLNSADDANGACTRS